MRRPAMGPEVAAAAVQSRNTMAGMAGGRVPSAWPVPRTPVPRILGGLRGTPAPPPDFEPLCDDDSWVITAQTSTSVRFEGSGGAGVALSVVLNYDCTATGAVTPEVRVYEGDDEVWSDWEPVFYPDTITGPDLAGTRNAWFGGGWVTVTVVEVRWDVVDAFTGLCIALVDNT